MNKLQLLWPGIKADRLDSFLAQIGEPDTGECRPWRGVMSTGLTRRYPVAYVGRAHGKSITLGAHRVAWALAHGRQPDHRLERQCGTEECVEPTHWIEVATQSQASRKAKRGEASKYFASELARETDECKVWPFGGDAAGYGIVGDNRVHVLACEAEHGPMPEPGMEAAHGPCHNRRCFNGRHLTWKTRAENVADMFRDNSISRGEKRSSLTEADVREIRLRLRRGESRKSVAAAFGLTYSGVRAIQNGATWNHVDPDRPAYIARSTGRSAIDPNVEKFTLEVAA